jgi:hypothetical protein
MGVDAKGIVRYLMENAFSRIPPQSGIVGLGAATVYLAYNTSLSGAAA